MKIALSNLATLVGGTVLCGDPDGQITGFASLKEAIPGDLSFFHDPRYNERLVNTKASAILVPLGWKEFPPNASCIEVSDPSRSFEKIVETYGFQPAPFAPGVHPSAVVADGVAIDGDPVGFVGGEGCLHHKFGQPRKDGRFGAECVREIDNVRKIQCTCCGWLATFGRTTFRAAAAFVLRIPKRPFQNQLA